MTGLIDRLEKQGLVTRERTNDDRRLVKVKLTDAGRVAVSVLDSHITERLTSVLLVLAADDRETFARLFIQILTASSFSVDVCAGCLTQPADACSADAQHAFNPIVCRPGQDVPSFTCLDVTIGVAP